MLCFVGLWQKWRRPKHDCTILAYPPNWEKVNTFATSDAQDVLINVGGPFQVVIRVTNFSPCAFREDLYFEIDPFGVLFAGKSFNEAIYFRCLIYMLTKQNDTLTM